MVPYSTTLKTKLRGSALQMSIFVIVVVALLLMSFVLYIFTFNKFKQQSKNFNNTITAAEQGIDKYLKLENINPINNFGTTYLNENGIANTISTEAWGALKLIKSTAGIKNYKFEKVALLGSTLIEDTYPALYLLDARNALVVVGNTKIEGAAYVSESGVKSGSINGVSYYNTQYIFGDIRLSDKNNLNQIVNFNDLNQFINSSNNLQSTNASLKPKDSVVNSFLNSTLKYQSNQLIVLSDVSLTGNIIISSSVKITVLPTARLTDVILMAPEVDITNNFTGSFQVIAENNISIGKNCTLNYPSVLAVVPSNNNSTAVVKENGLTNNMINIGERSVINGVLIYQSNLPLNKTYPKPNIWLQKNAVLNGQIFNSQYTEVEGIVNGSVYTKNFLSRNRGSTFINHIYNGTINSKALNINFVGMEILDNNKNIIKWLY
jgi:hypothetical protein